MTEDKSSDEAMEVPQQSRLTRVFVYGTLMQGEHNHRLLAGSAFLGGARTEGRFTLHDLGGCPAMTRGGSSSVIGEVYEVTPEVLYVLDELEGHPDWYERARIELEDGTSVEAYLLGIDQVQGAGLIPSGDWRKRAEKT